MEPRINRGAKKQRNFVFALFLLGFFVLSILILVVEIMPGFQKVAPFEGQKNAVTYLGKLLPASTAMVQEGEVLLSFSYLQKQLDPDIRWDEKSNSVIITTKDKVLQFPENRLEAFVNGVPFQVGVPVTEVMGQKYIPLQPLENIYPIRTVLKKKYGVIVLEKSGDSIQHAKVAERTTEHSQSYSLRTEPSLLKPYIAKVQEGAPLEIYGKQDGWDLVQLDNGLIGYMQEKDVQLTELQPLHFAVQPNDYVPRNPLAGKVNLTWEHVVTKNPSTEKIPDLPGVNVVSPTWFALQNESGDILSKASMPYVNWAHERGYQVWALFGNGFNPDRTHSALSSFATRSKMIAQLLEYAAMYHLDGINIDFENVYLKDKDNLVQFIRELTPYLHEKNVIVSMDVTVKSKSEQWSLFYDRARLSQSVDYMIVMTYDEHTAGSKIAGSVASLPWVEQGLKGVLTEIPASKLLLGVPYYTRLWKVQMDSSGIPEVSSKALGMEAAERWVKERKLTSEFDQDTGQEFVEYADPKDGATYKMWLETDDSIRSRAVLVQKYGLAGIASWRRGFEDDSIWPIIESVMADNGSSIKVAENKQK